MSVNELAGACGLSANALARVEAGSDGLPGELQDYLTERGENVSWLASEQSEFVAAKRTRASKKP